MIYTQDANFPYPLLVNGTSDYVDSLFDFEITSLSENTDNYIFSISYEIKSGYLRQLIEEKKAQLFLIINSKDNQFHALDKNFHNLPISKSRLSFSANNKKTALQLMIQSCEDICFRDNSDLNPFYDEFKQEIIVKKGMALGFSNVIAFDGTQKKPHDLFEKKLDPNISSAIKIELSSEIIRVTYKDEAFQFSDFPQARNLNNPYLYLGLQKALINFLIQNADNISEGIEDILKLEVSDLTPLDNKLYTFMKEKRIKELNMENIDHVIHLISDSIIEKYVETVRGLKDDN